MRNVQLEWFTKDGVNNNNNRFDLQCTLCGLSLAYVEQPIEELSLTNCLRRPFSVLDLLEGIACMQLRHTNTPLSVQKLGVEVSAHRLGGLFLYLRPPPRVPATVVTRCGFGQVSPLPTHCKDPLSPL